MINKNRIVPVVKTDLLSLYGTIIGILFTLAGGLSYDILKSSDILGDFSVTGTGDVGMLLCDQPVKTLDISASVTACAVYFVAAYDFAGITVAGAAATFNSSYLDNDDVSADAATLYRAVLDSGTVTLRAITPVAE